MKLLYTGPLKDFSGFGHASRNLLRALSQNNKLNIVARPLKYDQLDAGQSFQSPEWMTPLLENDLQNVDLALQMTTCNVEAVPVPGVPNGLYTFFETNRIQKSWSDKANEFDFLVVPSKFNAQTLLDSGVTRPILVAGPPCDADLYKKDYVPFGIQMDGAENRTVFYNICQLSTKKGIDVLLRAYYAAFAACPEEVLLVLKTYVGMQDRSNDLETIRQYVGGIKSRCRIPITEWPPVLPVTGTISDDEIHGIHTRGDAYVCTSRSEGWGIPVFDALGHGNVVISHDQTGLGEFVNQDNSLVYGGAPSFFFDCPHPDPGLFTGVEQCFEPSAFELAAVMQKYHRLNQSAKLGTLNSKEQEEWSSVQQKMENGKVVAERLDYRNAHEQFVEQLVSILETWKSTGVARFDEKSA